MQELLLTIITPTYNRAYTLPSCYRSLCRQTDQRFKWLIIDDGSTDETEEVVNSWIQEKKIEIEYLKKENGGKASALNLGLDKVDTEYVVCLDSDDYFYSDAVEKALNQLAEIEGQTSSCGILALRTNPDGTVMGGESIPLDMKYVKAADVFLKLNLHTELICFYKTKILKKYRFPVFEGEKFVSPAWMQYQITQEYNYAVSWDKFCCCEYVSDGLTQNKKKVILNNPKGYTCVKRWSFDLAPSPRGLIKNGIMYDCGCLLGKDKNWLKNVRHKGWAVALMPVAYLVKRIRFGQK